MTMAEMVDVAGHLARSGYFRDANDVSKAVAKILYGREIGIGPLAAMMGVHIIEGKPAPSAGLISALVLRSGRYRYDVELATDEACTLAWFRDGARIGTSSFTMEAASRAQVRFKDRNGQPTSWARYPSDMLFARALTQGARRFCPDVFLGAVYMPEELGEGNLRMDRAADAGPWEPVDDGEPRGASGPAPAAEPPLDMDELLGDARALEDIKTIIKMVARAEWPSLQDKWDAAGEAICVAADMIQSAQDVAEVRVMYAWAGPNLGGEHQTHIETTLADMAAAYPEAEAEAEAEAETGEDFDPDQVVVAAAHWQAAGLAQVPPQAAAAAGGVARVTLGHLLREGCTTALTALAGIKEGVDDVFAQRAAAVLAVAEGRQ